jgi:Phage portal protein
MGMFDNLVKSFRLGSTPVMPHGTEEELSKGLPTQDSKSIIEDPLALVQSMGFKDKPNSLSYETLKKMATRNSVIASIIQTRVNQISTFSQPARYTRDGVGFEIKLRDPKKKPSAEQKNIMLALEAFLENCGFKYDPARDDFDTLLRKLVRDSLSYDQMTMEIVPDRLGRPAELHAVDAATVRAASVEPDEGDDYIHPSTGHQYDVKWVQVIDNVVATEFTGYELAFGVRNPRTDINVQPYGLSELEILVHQVTAHLWAEEYNSRYFSQGGTTKGILNLKGMNISKEQLDAFRRQWTAQLAGVTGAWKTPVVSVDGLEYINVSQSNREMEYEMWMNYLINISCAVYQIDPSEINFPNRGGAGGSGGGGLGDGGIEDRLKNSKDKGLRPLLRYIESYINRHVIRRFSTDYSFNFVGLSGESEAERMELENKKVRSTRTINEMRAKDDLEPIEHGDIILDPTYTNYVLQKEQNEQMMQQEQAQGDPNADPNEETEEADPEEQVQQQEDSQISQSIDTKYQ